MRYFLLLAFYCFSNAALAQSDSCLSGDCSNGKGLKRYANGIVGKGTFANGKLFYGELTYPDGSVFIGSLDDTLRLRGETKFPAAHSVKSESGRYKDGQLHTSGEEIASRTYRDGGYYIGSFQAGLRHGKGRLMYDESSPEYGEYAGGFEHDLYSGTGVREWRDKAKKEVYGHRVVARFSGEWKRGKKNGYGTWEFPDSSIYKVIGPWKDDSAVGIMTFVRAWDPGKGYDSFTVDFRLASERPKNTFALADVATKSRDNQPDHQGVFDRIRRKIRSEVEGNGTSMLAEYRTTLSASTLADNKIASLRVEKGKAYFIVLVAYGAAYRGLTFKANHSSPYQPDFPLSTLSKTDEDYLGLSGQIMPQKESAYYDLIANNTTGTFQDVMVLIFVSER